MWIEIKFKKFKGVNDDERDLPGGVLPTWYLVVFGASPDGDAVCEGNGLGIGAVERTGGCVAFQ